MATNVLNLRRPNQTTQQRGPLDDVSIVDKRDIFEAATALNRMVRSHGLRIMAWHDLATLEPMLDAEGQPVNIAPFGWSEQELAPWHNFDKAARSPLLRAARVSSEPVRVNRHGIYSRLENRFLDQVALDNLELSALAKPAIVVPVHMPFGQVGAAILTSCDADKVDLSAEFTITTEILAPVIARFIGDFATVTLDNRYMPVDTILSRREVECLTWVARGKTDHEISIILGCSHAGVRYHVARLCEKLGSVNRAQSVYRACQLGYLGSPDRHV